MASLLREISTLIAEIFLRKSLTSLGAGLGFSFLAGPLPGDRAAEDLPLPGGAL